MTQRVLRAASLVAALGGHIDVGEHQGIIVGRFQGQLGDDLHLTPFPGVSVEEASVELDGADEDAVAVIGTEELEGEFGDTVPEVLSIIEAVGFEEPSDTAQALSGEDQGKAAILCVPGDVLDLGDGTERIT